MIDQQLIDSLRVINLPMKTQFRGVDFREIALMEGEFGWGEFSPFLEYSDAECAPWLACAIEAATVCPPEVIRSEVAVNGIIPDLIDKNRIQEIVETYSTLNTFKIKINGNLDEDIERINYVRSLKQYAHIRLDANGALSVERAEKLLEQIGDIEYIEQPCATLEELRELKNRVDVKIAGDEVLRKAANPFNIDLKNVIDYLILKVQPLGGIKRSRELAQHHGLPVIISSALESAVGINYGLILAASLEDSRFDCGLATGSLFTLDVANIPIINGKLRISKIEPNFDAIEVTKERGQWWKNRIMRTAQYLV